MSTPHITAQKGDIAKTVLMPGDPLRAKFIAETFLEDARLVNDVRNMFAYTGTYKGKPVTVMGSGMGMPSIGIYSYELYNVYDVENIIRIGSAGAYTTEVKLYDVVLSEAAYSESSYAKVAFGYEEDTLYPSEELNSKLKKSAEKLGYPLFSGTIHSSDVFYRADSSHIETMYQEHKALVVEMESFGLFANARYLNKNAACLVTVSDSLITHEVTTAQQRQTSFTKMMEIALNSIFED